MQFLKSKMIKSLLALCILFSIFFSTLSVAFASNYHCDEAFFTVQQIKSIASDTLSVSISNEGLTQVETIENIDVLKSTIKQISPTISDYQLGKIILISLGDTPDFINSLPMERVIEALTYTSVVRREQYFHITESNQLLQIDKGQFYTPINYSSISDIPDYEEPFGDLILRSTAYKRTPSYALPGRNYWSIRGEVEWIGNADFSFTDLLVISSTGNIDNNFPHNAGGVWDSINGEIYDTAYLYSEHGGDGDHIEMYTPSVYGLAAEFDVKVKDVIYYYVNRLYMYYGVYSENDINCQVAYAHEILGWTPSVEVSIGGISFGGVGLQRQTFYGTTFSLSHD